MSTALTISDLSGNPRRVRRERRMKRVLLAAALTSILVSVLIVFTLFREAWTFASGLVRTTGLGALLDSGAKPGWYPRDGRFDLVTIVVGSLIVSAVAMVVAAPLGLGAAVYLSEYASPRARRWLKPVLEVLAGVPSVVFGFFALRVLGPDLIKPLFGTTQNTSLLVTGVAIGLLVTPLMASISEDALRSVPQSLREASTGLGARKSTTVIKVVLPAALSGIVAAFIVAVSRALGETLVVTLAAGAAGGAQMNLNPTGAGLTMTAAMANLATGSDQVTGVGNAVKSLYLVGALLFLFTLGLNLVADRFVRRFRQAY